MIFTALNERLVSMTLTYIRLPFECQDFLTYTSFFKEKYESLYAYIEKETTLE